MNIDMFQRVGDWFGQRREYRQAALVALRKREGLPQPVDQDGNELVTRFDNAGNVHYFDQNGNQIDRVLWAGAGRDGKPGSFAIGTKKQEPRELADVNWHSTDAPFDILEVAEDGRKLSDELLDLNRDSATYERAERVSHGDASEQAPELVLDGTSDEEVEQKLQEYLKRGK